MAQRQTPDHADWETWKEAAERVNKLLSDGSEPEVRELEADGAGAGAELQERSDDVDVDVDDGAEPRTVEPPTPVDASEGDPGSTGEGTPGCPECGTRDWFDPEPFGVSWEDVRGAGPGDSLRGCPRCSDGRTWVIYGV